MKRMPKKKLWEEAGEIYKLAGCSYNYIHPGQGTMSGRDMRYNIIHLSYGPYSLGLEQGDDVGALSDRRQIRS